MQAVQFTAPEEINIIDLPEPSVPGPGEALVRTHRMGICGTDLACYLGKFPFFAYPRTPGHELGLEVVAVADDVTNVRPGDKCSLEPYVNNPESATSRKGSSNCCPGVQVIGVHNNGGLRKGVFAVPARKLHPGNDLSYDQLALVETLAIGYHAVQRGNPQPGETVLVIGAGPIGLASLEFLKLMDVKTIVMDMNEQRLEFVREVMGIPDTILTRGDGSEATRLAELTGGELAHVVIDATGSNKSMSHALNYCAFAGRLVYVGITQAELSFLHSPVMHRRELTLMASRNALVPDFTRIISLIETGRINTQPWITHRAPFSSVIDAFPGWLKPESGVIKAVVSLD